MDVNGTCWVTSNERSSQATTGPASKEGRKDRFGKRAVALPPQGSQKQMKVLRVVRCWEVEPGEIPLAGDRSARILYRLIVFDLPYLVLFIYAHISHSHCWDYSMPAAVTGMFPFPLLLPFSEAALLGSKSTQAGNTDWELRRAV